MRFLIAIFLLISLPHYPQSDYERWEKKDISYKVKNISQERNYSFKSENVQGLIFKSLFNFYHLIISDVDGDNCPFRPSCSAFFLEAAEKTNIFQASLMFFDRFTRDVNVFKTDKYPRTTGGYYYDPVSLYTLKKISFVPSSAIIIFDE